MFSKKFFIFIMSVFLLSFCSTTNASRLAPFYPDGEALINLIRLGLDKNGYDSITIGNVRYYTDERGNKHLLANFNNDDKNEIDFFLYKNGSVGNIAIKENFSAQRKFSKESQRDMLTSIVSSMCIVVTICDIFEFNLRPNEMGGFMSRHFILPMLNDLKAGRTPEPKIDYINLYNRQSELCDVMVAYNYEKGGITYVMLKSA